MLSGGVTVAGAAISASTLLSPSEAVAAGTDVVSAGTIKVTPIAHTFLTTGGTPSPKPVRENDATRYFTNARVVYLFDGKDGFIDNLAVAEEVTELTTKRKAERGPGVTPGNVQTLAPSQLTWKGGDRGTVVPTVVEAAKQMADGDVLLVGPIPTGGTADDGKLLASTAYTLGTFVGGKKEQGVISVLLNGPKENLKLSESGFPVSELLWYSLPPKKK